ncbi:MAG: UDP-glucose/GDP-mannose dehydrogenase family protein [Candidatus Sericytochromatia bacterium]|nr:UDP-glucose/GDP-mannose dehydrogenase family protein [Candidatus Sericytochromatia bacterium]
MRICVVGTGYVGLVTGACLAHVGHQVVCVDRDAAKVEGLERGVLPIFEPGLPDLVRAQRAAGRLAYTTDLAAAVSRAEVVFITVGTPPAANGEADLSSVEAVARGIGAALNGYKVIVNKSTVPIGCGDWVAMLVREGIAARRAAWLPAGATGGGQAPDEGVDGQPPLEAPGFDVVSCPEFLREGSAIHDTFHGDRIVVGSASPRAIGVMRALYAPLIEQRFPGGAPQRPIPFIVTDLGSAEMIKYAANCFLATKVSFINEIANVCERVGADVTQVAAGIGLDHRIGRHFLNAGIGWGGSCFPKDVRAMTHIARDYGYDARLLAAVIEVNEAQRQVALVKLQQHLKSLKGKTIGLLGLAFKPDTDDLREAPAMGLARQLLKLGASVRAYDPIAASRAQAELPALRTCDDPYVVAEGCDALVVATEWPEFRTLDLGRMRLAMRGHHVFIDGRNQFEPAVLKELGFLYVGVGR